MDNWKWGGGAEYVKVSFFKTGRIRAGPYGFVER